MSNNNVLKTSVTILGSTIALGGIAIGIHAVVQQTKQEKLSRNINELLNCVNEKFDKFISDFKEMYPVMTDVDNSEPENSNAKIQTHKIQKHIERLEQFRNNISKAFTTCYKGDGNHLKRLSIFNHEMRETIANLRAFEVWLILLSQLMDDAIEEGVDNPSVLVEYIRDYLPDTPI